MGNHVTIVCQGNNWQEHLFPPHANQRGFILSEVKAKFAKKQAK